MPANINLKSSEPGGDDPLGTLHVPGVSHFALVRKAVEEISLTVFEAIVASIRSATLEGGRIYIFAPPPVTSLPTWPDARSGAGASVRTPSPTTRPS